jgi:hypothetical protein
MAEQSSVLSVFFEWKGNESHSVGQVPLDSMAGSEHRKGSQPSQPSGGGRSRPSNWGRVARSTRCRRAWVVCEEATDLSRVEHREEAVGSRRGGGGRIDGRLATSF